jgi:hypothetical protein
MQPPQSLLHPYPLCLFLRLALNPICPLILRMATSLNKDKTACSFTFNTGFPEEKLHRRGRTEP